ncbi:class I SAM-dependent methyltransferase [Pelotalea chapellei]|uniref:Methyltransferase n=1 Tax=Pelotalea chapellei TaxID=44671 RepID=A0ABS5U5N4_9BACT|nr:class I SAM-dependent methyltransferase [Pelotalea chapellei]MBT1070971.1 methyltransferase [Pelotalea chapellei]
MKKMHNMVALEESFVRFISEKNSQTIGKTREAYLEIRERFDFSSKKYRSLCENVHSLHEMFYLEADDVKLFNLYDKLEYLHVLRHLSYSFEKKTFLTKIKHFLKTLITRDIKSSQEHLLYLLHEQKNVVPIVVDYGAGLGRLSFEIGRQFTNTQIYLIDIDSVVLRFAEFYFKENLLNVATIKVDGNNLYPVLPDCNVCICSEVLEHVNAPIQVFNNIVNSLQSGGLLYGDFEDHLEEFLHVSTDLSDIRNALKDHFDKVFDCIYRKK